MRYLCSFVCLLCARGCMTCLCHTVSVSLIVSHAMFHMLFVCTAFVVVALCITESLSAVPVSMSESV